VTETLGSLRSRILRMLGDPEGTAYSNELLVDSIGEALDAILPWIPKTAIASITGNGSATAFALPTDCYQLQAVVIQVSGEILSAAVLSPGQFRGTNLATINDWIEYPSGYITFSKVLANAEIYDCFYHAHWTKPSITTPDDTVMEPPGYAMTGVVLYASAFAILPSSVSVSEVRNWLTKADSGIPEHNPMQKTASYLLSLFTQEMNRHPKANRATR